MEGCGVGLLYIISHDKYLKHYRKGWMKYIPYGLIPNIKARVVEDIKRQEEVIGKIVGVNIKPIDFNCKESLENYIGAIKKLDLNGFDNIYIEEIRSIPDKSIDYMEESLGLKLSKGIDGKIPYIPLVIKDIYKIIGSKLEDQEVLVMSKDKETSKKLIKMISKDIKFITNLGLDLEGSEEIYEYILQETGLSLINSSGINENLKRYNIVINFSDDFKLEALRFKGNAIIFDFGRGGRALHSIKDFGFRLEDLDLDENKWIENRLDSSLYGILNKGVLGQVLYLYCGNSFYTLDEYVKEFLRLKGSI